jgi:hypothetical protein
MRRVLLVTAAVVAAVVFFALATLPPRPQQVDTSGIDPDLIRRTVRGAYHVHTTRSDGAADRPAIAAAAARAGLKFVIFTDHGDGTAPPDPPAYISGVLCIDGVEISTNDGHYVALGMARAPYPLGGDGSAVVEDVARLGGFGIAAHPDSPKASLRWTDWEAPIDGIEWLSADSEWRDESRSTLVRTFLSYLIRPGPALASLLDRPVTTLKRWDELTRRRPVVALAAHDAHGGIGRGMEESGERKPALGHVPSYEASFRTFSDSVILDAPLSGDAAVDGTHLLDAIRRGRVFTVVDALATPGYVGVRRTAGTAAINATLPAGGEIVEMGDDRKVAVRFEVRIAGAPGSPPVPWLVTNPVYLSAPPVRALQPLTFDPVPLPVTVWQIEKDARTEAAWGLANPPTDLHYTLARGARASQFAALAVDFRAPVSTFTHVVFTAAAKRPCRISVQLRYAGLGGERWGRSVYLDTTPREIAVPVDQMRPLDRQPGRPPDPAAASSLLLVVDLTNARPGDSNDLTIANLSLARSPAAPR